jgi:hypothetical protein
MPTQSQPRTVLQFSLRSILAAATILSVLLAVFVPLLRAQPPTFRGHLLWGILISTALAVVGLGVLCRRRWRIEIRGGRLLLRPKRLNLWIEYLPCALMVVIFGGFLVGACVMAIPTIKNMSRLDQVPGLPPMGFVMLVMFISAFAPLMLGLVYAITLSWWQVTPMTLEIRENGVGIGGLRFLPWSAITGCQWMDGKHAAILTLWCHSRKYVVVMPLNTRESVQRLLEAQGIKPKNDPRDTR